MVTGAAHEAHGASRAVRETPPPMALAVAAKWLSRYSRAPMPSAKATDAEGATSGDGDRDAARWIA
ncbi:hypothetical protein D3C86_1852910 [compost metagenome]